jgi:hypothetical protein
VEELVDFLRGFFSERRSFEVRVSDLIAYCQTLSPHASWERLSNVDFEVDQFGFEEWLRVACPDSLQADSFRAFYLGIAEGGEAVRLAGCSDYNEADPNCEWACSANWHSLRVWSQSRVLDAFATISEESDRGIPKLLYVLALGYVGLLAQASRSWVVVGQIDMRMPVAVGFDDGDAYLVLPSGSTYAGLA